MLCCVVVPWYNIKVTMLRLQVVSEDLPAHFNAAALAGRPMGGTPHLRGSDGGLGDPQGMGVAVMTEQLWNIFVR